jgi:hypothetical protein
MLKWVSGVVYPAYAGIGMLVQYQVTACRSSEYPQSIGSFANRRMKTKAHWSVEINIPSRFFFYGSVFKVVYHEGCNVLQQFSICQNVVEFIWF